MRAKAFVILWGVAAIAATAIAWQGVNIVDSQVISPAPAITTARSSASAVPIEPAATPTPAATPAIGDVATTTPESDTGVDLDLSALADATPEAADEAGGANRGERIDDGSAAPTAPLPTATVRPRVEPDVTGSPTPRAVERPRATTPPVPTPTVRPKSTPVPTPPPPIASATPKPTVTPLASPTPAPAPAQVLTFDLVGGTASVSFSSSEVHVLWATPEPGFTARISNSGPGQRVDFDGDGGDSRLEVWWDAGPQWSIDEDHD